MRTSLVGLAFAAVLVSCGDTGTYTPTGNGGNSQEADAYSSGGTSAAYSSAGGAGGSVGNSSSESAGVGGIDACLPNYAGRLPTGFTASGYAAANADLVDFLCNGACDSYDECDMLVRHYINNGASEGRPLSASGGRSSSSQSGNSSAIEVVVDSGYVTDSRDGRRYKWVKIGTQTWMAENLDFGTRINESESRDQSTATAMNAQKYCYDDDTVKCAIYGGLYQWHTALALAQSCDTSSCASQISSLHRGICLEGWHIPSQSEWETFRRYVDAANGGETNDEGKSLKGKSGWLYGGAGTDNYGWNGLPGGNRGGGYTNGGEMGFWWVAAESKANAYEAVNRKLSFDSDQLEEEYDYGKREARSIRCVKD